MNFIQHAETEIIMKKYRNNLRCRIIAAILVIVCGMMAFASGGITLFTYQMGLYTKSLNTVIHEKQKNAQEINSMIVFEHRKEIQKNGWTLQNSNMEYGIIQGKNVDNIDLSEPDNYLSYHFDKLKPDKASYKLKLNENSDCYYSNRLLPSLTGGNLYHVPLDDDSTSSGLVAVKKLCYNSDDGIIYFNTLRHSYPVKTIGIDRVQATMKEIPVEESDLQEDYPGEKLYTDYDDVDDLVYFQLDEDTKKYVSVSGNYENLDTSKYKEWKTVTLDTFFTMGSYIQTIRNENLLPKNNNHEITTLISPQEFDYYADPSLHYNGLEFNSQKEQWECSNLTMAHYTITKEAESQNTYWIISTVKPKELWITENDLIAKQDFFLTKLYHYRYVCPVIAIVMSLLALLAALFCFYSAGYRQVKSTDGQMFCGSQNNVLLTWRQKFPLELYVPIMGGACLGFSALAIDALEGLFHGAFSIWFALFYGSISGILALWSGLMLCMNIAHRIHGKILGKYTICNQILLQWLKRAAVLLRQNTSLVCKGGILLAGINFVELFIIFLHRYHGFMLLIIWGWVKVLEFCLLIILLIQMKTLQKGSAELAEGNLSHKLDTSKMFWEFKKHGDNLNKINEGMAIALNERMKSEHFKTELITNVSHDIKTPLTSIINYVDLLQKENLPDIDKTEYLEVLDRQSKRLKKLIEDLIEASKASTGNLSVNLEPCNLDILLTQTAGEFQEKLSAANLELIIGSPDSSIQIQADNRHLWRVFDNLMNNICKYAQPGTRVYINQEISQDTVSIIFRNTSREPLNISGDALLERFVRGDSSRNTEGNGLGLSIAQSLTELMGGTLNIYIDGDLFKVIIRFSL